MPVQLSDGTLLEVLLGAGDVLAGGEVGDDLLAHPAAIEQTGVGVGEGPLQIHDDTRVGGFLAEVGRVGQVQSSIGATCATADELVAATSTFDPPLRGACSPRSGAPFPFPLSV